MRPAALAEVRKGNKMDDAMRFEIHRLDGGERGRLLRALYEWADQNGDAEAVSLYRKASEATEFYLGQWESESGSWELPL